MRRIFFFILLFPTFCIGQFIRTEQVKDVPLGYWLNTTFPGSSLPANFASYSATYTVSSGLNLSGGNGQYFNNIIYTTDNSASNNFSQTYEFTLNTKPATEADGLVMGRISANTNIAIHLAITFKMADATHGRLVLRTFQGYTPPGAIDSTVGTVAMTNGAKYRVYISVSNTTIYSKLTRYDGTGDLESTEMMHRVEPFVGFTLPNLGNSWLTGLGGDYTITKMQEYHADVIHPDFVFFGTSITQEFYMSTPVNHYTYKTVEGTTKKYVVLAGGGDRINEGILDTTELWAIAPATAVFVELGVNDNCGDVRSGLTTLLTAIKNRGLNPILLQVVAETCKDTIYTNLSRELSVRFINAAKTMNSDMYVDGVHPNDYGFTHIAKVIRAAAPDIIGQTGTIEQQTLYGLGDVKVASSPSNGSTLVYSTTSKKWETGASNSFINNNGTATSQVADFNITGSGTIKSYFAVGAQVTSQYLARFYENNNAGLGILLENAAQNGGSPGGNGLLFFDVYGSSAPFSSWNNAAVIASYPSAGFINWSRAGGIQWHTGSSATYRMGLTNSGQFGIGVDLGSITANLHLGAGTTTANTAPLKFSSGDPTTTPEAGAMHFKNGLWIIDSSNSKRDTILTRDFARNYMSFGGGGGSGTVNAGTANHLAYYPSSASTVDDINDITYDGTNLDLGNHKITSLASPVSDGDAATKAYTDALVSGVQFKQSVVAATTTSGTLASSFENNDAIDGVTLATGNRILIKDQASGSENGIYTVNASGAPTRATDYDAGSEALAGTTAFVTGGTANANTQWTQTTTGTITLGTTALVFSQTGGGSIANNSITNAKLAQMAAHTFKGNNTGSTANVSDLTVSQMKTELDLTGTNSGDQTTTGTSNEISVATGSTSPVISLASTLALEGKTVGVQDNNFAIKDNGDNSKQLKFELSGFTTSTTRNVTFPNADITVARIDAGQTFIGPSNATSWNLTTPVISSITNTGTQTVPTVTGTLVQYLRTSISSNATWSPAGDARENWYVVTAQGAAVTTISNPSGTASDGNELWIRVKDDGTARALTWSGTQWRASSDLALPTTTVINKTMYLKFVFNSADTKWDFISFLNNFGFNWLPILLALMFGAFATWLEKKIKRLVLMISIGCILFPIIIQAQTKLYLNTGVVCPINETLNASWNVTTGNTFLMAKPVKDGSTIATANSGNTGAAAVRKILIKSFITEPLANQTISSGSTISAQIRGDMSSVSSRTGQGWIYIRLLNANGTVASEIGSMSTTNYTTTLTNRTYSLTLGANLGITAGQRICFEIGWNYLTGSNTATSGDNSFGSSSATDLATDNTTTTANNPFITFSQTLIFQKPYKMFF